MSYKTGDLLGGFPGGSDSKESSCNAGDQVPALGQEDPLEKGMATHSSILAWEISWTEEPGKLQSMGFQRVRYDWATNTVGCKENNFSLACVQRSRLPSADLERCLRMTSGGGIFPSVCTAMLLSQAILVTFSYIPFLLFCYSHSARSKNQLQTLRIKGCMCLTRLLLFQKVAYAFSFSEPLIYFLWKEEGANMKENAASRVVYILLLFLNASLLNGK